MSVLAQIIFRRLSSSFLSESRRCCQFSFVHSSQSNKRFLEDSRSHHRPFNTQMQNDIILFSFYPRKHEWRIFLFSAAIFYSIAKLHVIHNSFDWRLQFRKSYFPNNKWKSYYQLNNEVILSYCCFTDRAWFLIKPTKAGVSGNKISGAKNRLGSF